MKTRYNTYDIVCAVTELQKLIGMRVNNIYDIDSKTYLIRLQKTEQKQTLLLESGNRIHVTNFEWPKNIAPSGFSMKLRKHLKNKRLEQLSQLGTDRIIDLQFGTGEAAYHIILELYDRGNIVLTDHEFIILNVLRPHTEGDKVRFAVKEKYPQNRARESTMISKEDLIEILKKAKPGDQLKKVIMFNTEYGPSLLEHVLLNQGFVNSTKINNNLIEENIDKIYTALREAEDLLQQAKSSHSKGFIVQKKEERATMEPDANKIYYSNQEFHPTLFSQHKSTPYKEFETFNEAVDEFFSSLEDQKLELKTLQQEREAMKKLENVRKDHDQRLVALEKAQEMDKQKAELITRNQELVEKAILAVRTALANQMSWLDIEELVKDVAAKGDPVAKIIKQLKLEINHISLVLSDPYANVDDFDDSDGDNVDGIPTMTVDIDLDLTAFANARKYYDQKRSAAKKQMKTVESQTKALKSAEKKTKQTLKDVQTINSINKARKMYWFEKFFWFISSENYLVIAGRDQQQNELIVKRYMKPTDVYVHADIHGASSVIIKNPTSQQVPPKTLNEAGTMAICYSVAWEAKVVANAYWVWGDQVSKTAPTGEYLTTGSFMIKGKKNFLPPSNLILGLSFLFRLEDSCIEHHVGERKVLTATEEDALSVVESEQTNDEVEVDILDESEEEKLNEEPTEETCDDGERKLLQIDQIKICDENVERGTEDCKFPDTQIKIQHLGGRKNILTEAGSREVETGNEENIIYLGDDKPVIIRSRLNSTREKKKSETDDKPYNKDQNKKVKDENSKQAKRGQKSKLKKIKEKYKDQDEEERKLRMDILKSSGTEKESKKNKKGKEAQHVTKKHIVKTPNIIKDVDIDKDEPVVQADVDMIDALTGIPLSSDELLFAIPVVAPYPTLLNYKFKVKLTPGTGKRGKAAKTAVAMFMKDRVISPREKDLLKAVKDEQMARNIPGKVKLSAPRLPLKK